MNPIKKAFGYVTRIKDGQPQVLVFQHPVEEAGIQIPKGTVEEGEDPYDAVIREMNEETGLVDLEVETLLGQDIWEFDGRLYERYFYKLPVDEKRDSWDHEPTGGGEEDEMVFSFFWISDNDQVELGPGHGDYLDLIFTSSEVKE